MVDVIAVIGPKGCVNGSTAGCWRYVNCRRKAPAIDSTIALAIVIIIIVIIIIMAVVAAVIAVASGGIVAFASRTMFLCWTCISLCMVLSGLWIATVRTDSVLSMWHWDAVLRVLASWGRVKRSPSTLGVPNVGVVLTPSHDAHHGRHLHMEGKTSGGKERGRDRGGGGGERE